MVARGPLEGFHGPLAAKTARYPSVDRETHCDERDRRADRYRGQRGRRRRGCRGRWGRIPASGRRRDDAHVGRRVVHRSRAALGGMPCCWSQHGRAAECGKSGRYSNRRTPERYVHRGSFLRFGVARHRDRLGYSDWSNSADSDLSVDGSSTLTSIPYGRKRTLRFGAVFSLFARSASSSVL